MGRPQHLVMMIVYATVALVFSVRSDLKRRSLFALLLALLLPLRLVGADLLALPLLLAVAFIAVKGLIGSRVVAGSMPFARTLRGDQRAPEL